MTAVSPWDNPEANPDELAALLDAGEPGPAPAWPWCSVAGCDHSRTIPAGETPEQRMTELMPAWVTASGHAMCACHPVLIRAAGREPFPCDASQGAPNGS
jgi:hypothetical protein